MKFPKSKAKVHQLSNGLHVILDPCKEAPVISTQLCVETGSIHEGRFHGAGISHLLEHMVFKGTKSFDGETLGQAVQGAGGQWNAYTTFDKTVYYIDGPALGKELFLKVLLEMVFLPTFPEDEFEKEKDVIRREIDMGLDDADSAFSRQLFETAYQKHERNAPVIGHLELFNQVSHADMLEYHKTRYTTDNAFLVISGDFDITEILIFLESEISSIPRSTAHKVQLTREPVLSGQREKTNFFSIPISKHLLAWQAPYAEDNDSAVLDLALSILGSGKSSRLYRGIRDNRKLCLYVGAWTYQVSEERGLLAISAELEQDKIVAFEIALQEELMELLNSALDAELQKAKRKMLVAQFGTLNTASGRASDLASNWFEARNLNYTSDYLAQIEQVTIHDIRRVLEKWMGQWNNIIRVSMHPKELEGKILLDESTHSGRSREINLRELDNGLKLVISSDDKVPMVSIVIAIKTGRASETLTTAGLNNLLASMLSKGTKSHSADEIANIIESLGASLSVRHGNNTTIVRASCLMVDLETIMAMLGEVLCYPLFPQEQIVREKEVLLNALQEEEQEPLNFAFKTLKSEIFGAQGYGIPTLGTEESIAALDRLSLVAHHKKYITTGNMVMSLFGDVTESQAVALAEKYFKVCKVGELTENIPQELGAAQSLDLSLDKEQAVFTMGYQGCSYLNEDRFALGVLQAWFSDMSGPLFSKIREELGLAYFVSATQFHGHDCGLFAFYLGTSPEQIELAQNALEEKIAEIATGGMTEGELARVKTSMLAKQDLADQSNGAMAEKCAVDLLINGVATKYLQDRKRLEEVTANEVKVIANKYFAQSQPSIVRCLPEK